MTINAPEYVRWLYSQCLIRGVGFATHEVDDFSSLDSTCQTVINCTGLGALKFAKDKKVYPTRGQTVLVENTTNIVDTYSRVGQNHLSYLIPRPGNGGLIIGGCQQQHNWSYDVDRSLSEEMLHWAKTLYPGIFPEGHELKIIKDNVGLRPSRLGGPRVETERVDGRLLVHGYGIGGWGFQASWGLANKVVDLLEEALASREESHNSDGSALVFTQESALAKVKKAQALWNTRDPSRV